MLRLIDKRPEFSDGAAQKAAAALGVPALIAKLLYARGATDIAAMRAFLNPTPEDFHDPFLLPDMDRAVERIRRAQKSKENVLIYGDYDVDGVCASAMLLDFFQGMFGSLSYHVPSRHGEGYGMNSDAVRAIRARGVDLIITVDNGISAHGEIALCYELGMEVIVTDHHRCGESVPACEAVVAHTRKDSNYPAKALCGAATAFKLIEALGGRGAAKPYLPLAGLATVADVMPLVGENRALVFETLKALNRGEGPLGLLALCRMVNPSGRAFTARDLAFALAPRLNAAGRLEHASRAVELLCAEDEEGASGIAAELSALNARRQSEEAQLMREANGMLEGISLRRSIALCKDDWNPGILGIAASRLTEKHHVPVLLLCGEDDALVGSGRSVEGVDLYRALQSQGHLMIRYGGHEGAAGLTIARGNLEEFIEGFDAFLEQNYPSELFLPSCSYEIKADLREIDKTLAASLEKLAPFGEGNQRPLFYTGGVSLNGIRRIGGEGEHIKAIATQKDTPMELIGFYKSEALSRLDPSGTFGVVYHPALDFWKDEPRLQLQLVAVKPEFPEDEQGYVLRHRGKFYDAILDNLLYNYKNRQYEAAASCRSADDAIAEALNEDAFGSLIVCFTPEGAVRAMRSIRRNALTERVDLAFHAPLDPSSRANTLLLAPKVRELTGAYRRIIAADRAPAKGVLLALLEKYPDADVAACGGDELIDAALKALSRLDREVCKRHYRALRSHARKRYAGYQEAAEALEKLTGDDGILCRATLRVFEELSFIGCDATGTYGFYGDSKASDLMMSRTFQAIRAIDAPEKEL
ncbi:MAG: single-stranded-DNA-specific exonuclease RecJ [Bacillota bacterium]